MRAAELWRPEHGEFKDYAYQCSYRTAWKVITRVRGRRHEALPDKLEDHGADHEPRDTWEELDAMLAELPPLDAEIIRSAYGLRCERKKVGQLAAEKAVNRQYIGLKKRRALEALRRQLTGEL